MRSFKFNAFVIIELFFTKLYVKSKEVRTYNLTLRSVPTFNAIPVNLPTKWFHKVILCKQTPIKSHKDSVPKIVSQSAGRRPEKAVGNAASVHAADCRVQGGCVLSCDALSFLSLSCVLVYLDDVVISGIFFSAMSQTFFFDFFYFSMH